jgi:hypothetical protein
MALPPRLLKEVEQLELKPEITEDTSFINLVFRNYVLPPGYNLPTTDLLIRVPLSYPDGGPDMFWTNPALMLANGIAPQNGTSLETYMGQQWRRFSWHTLWKPNVDNLHAYLYFVHRRLEQVC